MTRQEHPHPNTRMSTKIPQPFQEELRESQSWRERIDRAAEQAGKQALRGRLTVESHIARLNALQGEAAERLAATRGDLQDGFGKLRAHLATLWAQCAASFEKLQNELNSEASDSAASTTGRS